MENVSSSSKEIGRLVIRDQSTGKPVGGGAPIFANEFPFETPHPEIVVWRYLDWFKFEDLVVKRRLYFRRADRLDDQMEGRFSKANREFTTTLWQRFHEAHHLRRNYEQEQRRNEMIRHRVFINCWHINSNENASMWRLYVTSADSVVICSRCGLLDSSTDGRAYQPVLVRYVSCDEPRPEFHSLAPYVFKDTGFSFENEVRLLSVAGLDETIYLERREDFYRTLLVRPEELILAVRTHPEATRRFRRRVDNLCAKHLSYLQPLRSSLDPRAPHAKS